MPRLLVILATFGTALPAAAQAPPSYDFDFATIGLPGNAPYPGGPPPVPSLAGRGSVAYTYRIARTEVTTAQWMEFVNTYSVRGGSWTWFAAPTFWGATPDPTYSGPGVRWRLDGTNPDAGRLPVADITWHDAARFCNWLHNGKGTTLQAMADGAYDTSTFAPQGGPFTDQLTHHPDAKFWIPTLDEWMKASAFDPDRHGPGQAGWWHSSYRSDLAPVPGLPGVGQTSAGLDSPVPFDWWQIPLGAYPEMRSPWGLLDTSGATSEWTENWAGGASRVIMGSSAGPLQFAPDMTWGWSHSPAWSVGWGTGLRVASAVPEPGSLMIFGVSCITALVRKRRT